MIHQFDPCAQSYAGGSGRGVQWNSTEWNNKFVGPQYLMDKQHALDRGVLSGCRILYRYVANPTNSRTMIATVGLAFPAGHTLGVLTVDVNRKILSEMALSAALNSFTFDWVLRLSFGGSGGVGALDPSKLLILPVPNQLKKLSEQIGPLALRLSGAAKLMANWWERQRLPAVFQNVPWHQLWAITPHERLRLRCILDAVVAHLYGLDPADFAWILRDCDHPTAQTRDNNFTRALDPKGFWRVDKEKDPELRHTVLALVAFHDLQQKGLDAFLSQNNGEGWFLPETLRLADYDLGHDDRAREAQPVAARLGPRFMPWQLQQSVEESWAECECHAENLRLLLGGRAPEAKQEAQPDEGPTDLFGQPVQRDLFGNIVHPKGKGKR